MRGWKSVLKADPTSWLLEEDNPSVRYYTLRDILDKPEDDLVVQEARQRIIQHGIVPAILSKLQQPEYLRTYPEFYTSKYKGLVWQIILLAELGADKTSVIRTQCEYIISYSQEKQHGGFSMHASAKTGGGRVSEVIPCLTGNMVWSLARFGYIDDPRLQRAVDWITRYMRFNDGVEHTPQVAPYDRHEMCWGKHTCHMGVVKTLKALSVIPKDERTAAVKDVVREATEFMLVHHVYKRSHNLNRIAKPGWLRFSFPLMYQTDALEVLDILTGLGVRDSRMDDAINIVLSKQDESGRYKNENGYTNERLLFPVENKDEQSKWLTLRAMRVLKRYYSDGQ